MEKEQININKEVTIALQQWSKNIERVPEGYFEGAPQQVLQAIKKKKTTLIYTLSKLSVAAIFIAIIANVYFIHNSNIFHNYKVYFLNVRIYAWVPKKGYKKRGLRGRDFWPKWLIGILRYICIYARLGEIL